MNRKKKKVRIVRFPDFKISAVQALAFSFVLGFVVRLIPEVLAFPDPIGFDTIYYAAAMTHGVIWPHWSTFFTTTWLFNAITVPLYSVSNIDPFLLLKVLAPALFGLNVAGIYWFSRKTLGWNTRISLLSMGFFALQLASLRISWDLLRNTLGLGLLLFTLPFIYRLDSKRGLACFVLLSLLTVFAHEYAAVTLFVVVFSLVVLRLVKGRAGADFKRLVVAFSPALAVFLVGFYFRFFPIRYAVTSAVIGSGDSVSGSVGKLFFLVNYLSVKSAVDFYASYFDLVFSVTVLFSLLYLSYLFLVWKGFFRNEILDVWTGLLLVGSFSCLIVPFFALELWHRWMFMLAYPFTFYAVSGLAKLFRRRDGGNFLSSVRFSRGLAVGAVLLTIVLAGVYLATPVLMNTVNVGIFSVYPAYKYFSSSPTVPYSDVANVIQAVKWLDGSMNGNSCVILYHAFLQWGSLYLNKSHVIVHFDYDVDMALKAALEHGFSSVYFVWWNHDIGWYGVTVPNYFARIEDFGRISVFEFSG